MTFKVQHNFQSNEKHLLFNRPPPLIMNRDHILITFESKLLHMLQSFQKLWMVCVIDSVGKLRVHESFEQQMFPIIGYKVITGLQIFGDAECDVLEGCHALAFRLMKTA